MAESLFAPSFWMPLIVALLGGVVFLSANRRQHRRGQRLGLVVLGLGVVWGLVAYAIDTPMEKCTGRTRAFLRAFDSPDRKDFATIEATLSPNTSVNVQGVPFYWNRDQVMRAAKQYDTRLKSVQVLSLRPQQSQTIITVTADLLSRHDETLDRPVRTTWEFRWEKYREGWVLKTITATEVEQGGLSNLTHYMPNVP